MCFRIEQDISPRAPFAAYRYRIYENDRLIARYWHDHKGDDHGITFVGRSRMDVPEGTMIEFITGGGPDEPLQLTAKAVAYLKRNK